MSAGVVARYASFAALASRACSAKEKTCADVSTGPGPASGGSAAAAPAPAAACACGDDIEATDGNDGGGRW